MDRDWLDAEFPLGEGVADTVAEVQCPCCGESYALALDPGGGVVQRYVEDCQVCCRPLSLTVRWSVRGEAQVEAVPEDEA